MKVLVVGSGGREHALVWKIAQSKRVKKVYASPGNGGIGRLAELVPIKADDITGLLDFAKKEVIDLTVVGPETPLVGGIVDEFDKSGFRIFGPRKVTAQLEGSKVFAKELMRELDVPTADFEIFADKDRALSYVKTKKPPIVVKADGLASGKGVFVCATHEEAKEAISQIMAQRVFGDSGNKVVIEECLEGEEASIIVLSDGENIVPLASSQDHKRVFDDDRGPNTGGMGAYSPAPVVRDSLFRHILELIIYPIIRGLKNKGMPYKGVLYAGIMVTPNGPYVLEFNVRFGDPETQAILPRLRDDIVDLIEYAIDGKLSGVESDWDRRGCVCVVAASAGYPGAYEKGKAIRGLDEAERLSDVHIFHAGTKVLDGDYVTDGGRVVGVTALGNGIEDAIRRSYEAVHKIYFEGIHYRSDIGKQALRRISA